MTRLTVEHVLAELRAQSRTLRPRSFSQGREALPGRTLREPRRARAPPVQDLLPRRRDDSASRSWVRPCALESFVSPCGFVRARHRLGLRGVGSCGVSGSTRALGERSLQRSRCMPCGARERSTASRSAARSAGRSRRRSASTASRTDSARVRPTANSHSSAAPRESRPAARRATRGRTGRGPGGGCRCAAAPQARGQLVGQRLGLARLRISASDWSTARTGPRASATPERSDTCARIVTRHDSPLSAGLDARQPTQLLRAGPRCLPAPGYRRCR